MIAIADSGSTKTQWLVFDKKGNDILSVNMKGLNPYHVGKEEMLISIGDAFKDFDVRKIQRLYFYGAGCGTDNSRQMVYDVLASLFTCAAIDVNSDIVGAARALFHKSPGIAVILGTGSNTVVYDGDVIVKGINSLGYILGDEGSGSVIGRNILQMYFRNQFSPELKASFEKEYKHELSGVLENLYKKPGVNRYLASFAPFAGRYKNHENIAVMLDKVFGDYFTYQLLPLKTGSHLPLGVIGSVGFYFADVFGQKAKDYGYVVQKTIKQPANELKQYHLDEL